VNAYVLIRNLFKLAPLASAKGLIIGLQNALDFSSSHRTPHPPLQREEAMRFRAEGSAHTHRKLPIQYNLQ
jgi:hypothetical protein